MNGRLPNEGPAFVAEIEYGAWTNYGKLRHPSIKGLRDTDDAVERYRLTWWPQRSGPTGIGLPRELLLSLWGAAGDFT
jgi:hypothetical protein